jgi:MFS family permease
MLWLAVETVGREAVSPITIADAPAGGLFSAERRLLTAGLILVVTLTAFEALAVATAMPVVEEDLGGLSLYGLVFSGFMVANIVGAAYAGQAADRGDPAAPLAGGLVVFGIGLIIAGAAPSMEVVVASRVIQGLGAGVVVTLAYVGIARGYDEALRPRMFAALSSAWVVPGLVGPVLAGAVADHISWRFVFLGLLPLLPLAGVLTLPALRGLRSDDNNSAGSNRLLLSLMMAFGAGMVLAGTAFDTIPIVLPLIAAGAPIVLFALLRLFPAGTFLARRGMPVAIAVMCLMSVTFFGAEAFLPFALTDIRDQSPTVAGLALTAATLSWAAGSWAQAHQSAVWSRRSMTVAGMLLITLGVAVAGTTIADGVPVVMAALGWTFGGFGMGLAFTSVSVEILSGAPEGRSGYASASLHLADVLGIAVGTGVAGAIVSAGESSGWANSTSVATVFVTMVSIGLFASSLSLRVSRGPQLDA